MSNTENDSEHDQFPLDRTLFIDDGEFEGKLSGVVLKKGPWTTIEDAILMEYVKKHGEGNWNAVQKHSGLFRCGKSCRFRWINHLRPNLKKSAFTWEEEQLIINLHKKMGNKWALMATHLPGHTDNEIKNYWNTRIKRCKRAGLPLYPPKLYIQPLKDISQNQNISGSHLVEKRPNVLLQTNCRNVPFAVFDSPMSPESALPRVPEPPSISGNGNVTNGLGSATFRSSIPPSSPVKNGFSSLDQFFDGAYDKSVPPFTLSFPLNHDLTYKNQLSSDLVQGGQSLSNGNFSASKPNSGTTKMELPSFQYPETDLGSWRTSFSSPLPETPDTLIPSPPNDEAANSDCCSTRNSGLLDVLILESTIRHTRKNRSSDKSSNSSTVVTPRDIANSSTINKLEIDWENLLGKEPHIGSFTESEFAWDDWITEEEMEIINDFDFPESDAFLASDCFDQSSKCVQDQFMMGDIATILGEDTWNKDKHIDTRTLGQVWEFDSCPSNDMPVAHDILKLP